MSSIRLEIRFEEFDAAPAGLIADALKDIESAIYQFQYGEIHRANAELKIPDSIFDAARFRMSAYRGTTLQLVASRKGSFILEGAVVAVAYWILKNTLGETLSDAYRETSVHRHLKSILLSDPKKQALRLVRFLDSYIEPKGWHFKFRIEMELRSKSYGNEHEQEPVISIKIRSREDRKIPPLDVDHPII